MARVTVRVGDYKTDSSGGRGDGSVEMAALDDDPIALRSALWAATDQAYKSALAAYAQKQAALKQVQTPPQADDFSQEKPLISLADPSHLHVDESAWAERVAGASGLYRTDATVKREPSATCSTRPQVFTPAPPPPGSSTAKEPSSASRSAEYQEAFAVGTQAADGMRLDRSYASRELRSADLDSETVFNKHAVDEIASLAELRKAPLVEEEYHGPLLLSADAAADTLRSLLAGAVTATRPGAGH